MKGNKGEWSELYTTLKLIADGKIYAADQNMERIDELVFPILKILRDDRLGKVNYIIDGDITLVDGVSNDELGTIKKSEFLRSSKIVFANMKSLSGRSISIDKFSEKDSLEKFLSDVRIESIKAKSTDKSDITIQIHDQLTGSDPILGFSIKSMVGGKSTLFNAGSGTNFIYRVDQASFTQKELNRMNIRTYPIKNKIGERIREVENRGGELFFDSIQSEKLELNLRLIDGDLPEILASMLKLRYLKNITKMSDLLEELNKVNPLNYNLKHGHPFYRYKLVKFLYDAALGMTPEAVWNGEINANGGIIVVKNDGEILAYHTYHKANFEEYLVNNTKLEQSATSEDENAPGTEQTKEKYPNKTIKPFKFGWLYLDQKEVKFKINLQVRFLK